MVKKLFLWITFCLFSLATYSQGEGDMWFFGQRVLMDFSNGGPVVNTTTTMTSAEGSSALSDSAGNLQFYGAGPFFFNKNHSTIAGWPMPGYTSAFYAQGNLLLPISDSIFYFFSLIAGQTAYGGLAVAYAKCSSTANNGLGQVLNWHNIIGDSLTEHMAAVRHADGESWWVLSHITRSDVFVKYQIDIQGNITQSYQQVGGVHPPLGYYLSPLVFNEQGGRFALSADFGKVEIFDFDRCTGEISLFNVIEKDSLFINTFYGISFSPNGKLIYVSDRTYISNGIEHGSRIFQFNLDSANIMNSEVLVFTGPPPCEPWWTGSTCRRAFGGHKLGPNGKIYIGKGADDGNWGAWDTLSIIHNPDSPGLACNYEDNAFALNPGRGSSTFPNIPNYRLGPLVAQVAEAGPNTTICPGTSTTLGIPDTSGTLVFTWWTTTGADGTLSSTSAAQPVATPLTATTYYLMVEDTTVHASCATTIDSVRIELYDTTNAPRAYAGRDTLICLGDSVHLGLPDPSGGSWIYAWSPSSGLSDPSVSTPIARPAVSTTYYLEVWDTIAGQRIPCREALDTVFIEVEELLEHPFPESQDFCPGEVLTIGLPPLPGFAYRWNPPFGLQNPHSSLTLVAPSDAITYQLQITDLSKVTDNCRSRTDLVILTTDGCILQNVLTPNGDGINDVLFLGLYNQAVQLAIYNRWGVKIYASSGYSNDFRGDGLADGVYYYVLKVSSEGGKEVVGNFVLLR